MSRIGKKPILVPAGVNVTISEENFAEVKGPKGTLQQQLPREVTINQEGSVITVTRPSEDRLHRSMHGLARSLLANMVIGVTQGYQRIMEIQGIGYRATREGKNLIVQVGFSHPIRLTPPEGITFEVQDRRSANEPQVVTISGIDKQLVGEESAKLRSLRPPEPYKGYGIRYKGEHIRRKAGKAGKAK